MNFIHAFAAHRVAANLLMLLMLLSGAMTLGRMEVRFFPQFDVQVVNVRANWPGASAEDVADALLAPLENELRNVADLKTLSSYARDGYGVAYLEFDDDTDLDEAASDARRYVDLARAKLPADVEAPEVSQVERRDDVMYLTLSGGSLAELRGVARRLEAQMLRLGVARVEVNGLPADQILIALSPRQLRELRLTPSDIGRQLAAQNVDVTAGRLQGDGAERLMRALAKKDDMQRLAQMQIIDGAGNAVRLADVAQLSRAGERDATEIFFNGQPAVEFALTRKSGGNAIAAAETILQWREQAAQTLPAGMQLTAHRQRWEAIESRMNLLLENGLQGLALVLLLLLLFFNARLALWVAAGIPATFMVALCVLHFTGGSLNMISMFALIMVTGIVVDDAIVVGENGYYKLQQGAPPLAAAVDGAKEMFPAVLSSTFTTLASFLPLLIVGGTIGAIIVTIPIVVAAVLLASLFECFFVLPGHMRHAFAGMGREKASAARQRFEDAFHKFETGAFQSSVRLALRYRWVTIALAFAMLGIAVALAAGGALKFRFFPGAELNRVQAQVNFVAGTPRADVERYMRRLHDSLQETAASFADEKNLLRHVSVYVGRGGRRQGNGDEKALLVAELSQPDERAIGTRDFTRAWRKRLPKQAGLENVTLREARGGPSGEDLQVRLFANDSERLKAAASDLKTALLDVPGVSRPSDDMPYGKAQTVFELTAQGKALNLQVRDIAAQLRAAYDGYRAQTLYEGLDEVEVRVAAREDGAPPADFSAYPLRLPDGGFGALSEVAQLRSRRGFDTIAREQSRMVANVSGNIDFDVTDVAQVQTQLARDVLPGLQQRHGVSYSFEGASANQRETVSDMLTGGGIALAAIFVILAAAFSSWTLPLTILLTVPFGIVGAMLGHWLLGYSMSILSFFGVFALMGIIVNDSIVLIRDYLARAAARPHDNTDELITESVCRRLRAILLTSLTTIGGLAPLLFETSVQAQFLIPMAVSIAFGLAFATLLILYLVPALVSVRNSCRAGVLAGWRWIKESMSRPVVADAMQNPAQRPLDRDAFIFRR